MAINAGGDSFYTTSGPNVTSDLRVSMFSDMEMPESVGGKRMSSFEMGESLLHTYDDEIAFQLLMRRANSMPQNKVKHLINSSSVGHDLLVEDLADLGSVNFRKASKAAKKINDIEKTMKPWVLLGKF